ncbi:unnamed protein product [Symbiodinium sp. CCMP2592]|nr:unnamed protein product [Symbiodinium sp. CCMP2592]
MTLLCCHLDGILGQGWCAAHLTQYADDTHAAWIFHSYEELCTCLRQLGVLMDALEAFGMQLNNDKAQAIFTVRGLHKQKARAAFTRKDKDRQVLVVAGDNGERFIPLVRSTVYLGARISYDQFESQTVSHRLQKANVRFWQLQKFFTSKRGLSIPQRVRMWLVTIRPTLLYAIDCCPMSTVLLRQVQTLVMKHIRAICSCPSHVTHISDADLLAQNNMTLPTAWLKEAYARDKEVFAWLPGSWQIFAAWNRQLVTSIAEAEARWCSVFAKHDAVAPATLEDMKQVAVRAEVPMVERDAVRLFANTMLFSLFHVIIAERSEPTGEERGREIELFFGGLDRNQEDVRMSEEDAINNKRNGDFRSTSTGKTQRGAQSRKGQGKGKDTKVQRKTDQDAADQSEEKARRIYQQIIRILVRHEDSIQTMRLDTGLVWFLQVGDETKDTTSIIPFLRAAAQKWHSKDKDHLEMSSRPLREILFLGILQRMATKLQEAIADKATTIRCQQAGWLTEDQKWTYQKFCRETRTLIRDTNKAPVAHETILALIRNMMVKVDTNPIVHRFCSLRKLDYYESGVAVFMQDLSIRDQDGTMVWQGLLDYQGCTAWQLIGVQYRRENLQRSPLIKELLQLLDGM